MRIYYRMFNQGAAIGILNDRKGGVQQLHDPYQDMFGLSGNVYVSIVGRRGIYLTS